MRSKPLRVVTRPCPPFCKFLNIISSTRVQVSVIDHAKPSELKRNLNLKFRRTFPHVSVLSFISMSRWLLRVLFTFYYVLFQIRCCTRRQKSFCQLDTRCAATATCVSLCCLRQCVLTRDVVLTKQVWKRTQKIAILKQLQAHFKAKCEKGAGTPFPRVPAPLHPWFLLLQNLKNSFTCKISSCWVKTLRTLHLHLQKFAHGSLFIGTLCRQLPPLTPPSQVNVTLSKIRSLEQQMTSVAKLFDLQSGVLTLAVSYFERLVFGSKVVKANRHHVAATCLLLSAKVHGDLRPDVLTQLISVSSFFFTAAFKS